VADAITIENIRMGDGSPLVLIAGPCVIESEESTLALGRDLAALARELVMPFIFKASFDKANRTSLHSFRGPGLKEGLKVLSRVKQELAVPVLSDVHTPDQVERATDVLDVLQIPAFLCRQTDLVVAAASSGRAVNIKKGQFLAPWDMRPVLEKATSTGNRRILLTERGTSFGYNNLVVDFRSLRIMQDLGCPVVFDATHSVQLPGQAGGCSGGDRSFIPLLARAAVVNGVDAVFFEVHQDPDTALCDGPNSLPLRDLRSLLLQLKAIRNAMTDIQ